VVSSYSHAFLPQQVLNQLTGFHEAGTNIMQLEVTPIFVFHNSELNYGISTNLKPSWINRKWLNQLAGKDKMAAIQPLDVFAFPNNWLGSVMWNCQ
jgi:hypothetical protein